MASAVTFTAKLFQPHIPTFDLCWLSERFYRCKNERQILCFYLHISSAIKPLPNWNSDQAINNIFRDDSTPTINNYYASLLQTFINNKTFSQQRQLHAHLLITGLYHDTFFVTKIATMYAICGIMIDARQVFDKMSERSSFLWNTMMRGYAHNGPYEEALTLFHQMKEAGIQPDNFTYPFALKACASLSALREGKEVHDHIIRTGYESDVFVRNALIDMYSKCGNLDMASKLFVTMPNRNVISWNVMIAGYAQNGHASEALALFHQMQRADVKSNSVTSVSALQACASLEALREGKNIHNFIIRNIFELDLSVENSLIAMYSKCGSINVARQVFDKMAKRNVVSFTALISGYAQDGRGADALNLFFQMQSEAIRGNCVTFVSVLKACGIVGDLQVGRQVHRHFFEAGFESNIIVGSSLVDMYAKCGGIEDARNVFDKMPEHNTVSLTAMVAGYAQWGNLDEALELFDQMSVRDTVSWNAMIVGLTKNEHSDKATKVFFRMQSSGMKADRITFASVLRACANLAVLQHGKQIHSHIVKTGFEMDLIVVSALVDMYAKCGSIENAMEVFDKMSERNVVSWTAMISACAQHGRGKDALQLFEKMQEACVKANEITYVSLLSACSHAGLVDEGRHFFNSMGEVHGITPKVEHYSCMVDLLGRAGFLDEAEEFMRGMPVEPNLAVWGALLGACRIHGNIQLAGRVAEQILQLKVQDNATYVLLSNTYAALGWWDGVAKVRKLMKNKGLKKQPGCSWIEVKSGLHVFISGDKSHPHKEEIYAMLDKLAKEIKQAGYVPGTNAVLLDVEEEQRELLLWCHSEKLAIAFGIISTPPRTTIRVMKNLRVCVDCHTAIKFISNTVQREIVVRDASRFHHFKDGQCSCGNYW